MRDSLFILIHHFDKPYKKKDIFYLMDYRIKNPRKKNLILSHDININDKCSDCKEFQPWILLKNCGEGLFLLKKLIEKCDPWITTTLQENINDLEFKKQEDIDNIFVLITKLNSREKLYELISKYQELIINSDVRIKNKCLRCDTLFPWIIIKNNREGFELVEKLNDNFKPYIILKKQKILYKHNIPKEILEVYKWTQVEERKYGKMKI